MAPRVGRAHRGFSPGPCAYNKVNSGPLRTTKSTACTTIRRPRSGFVDFVVRVHEYGSDIYPPSLLFHRCARTRTTRSTWKRSRVQGAPHTLLAWRAVAGSDGVSLPAPTSARPLAPAREGRSRMPWGHGPALRPCAAVMGRWERVCGMVCCLCARSTSRVSRGDRRLQTCGGPCTCLSGSLGCPSRPNDRCRSTSHPCLATESRPPPLRNMVTRIDRYWSCRGILTKK